MEATPELMGSAQHRRSRSWKRKWTEQKHKDNPNPKPYTLNRTKPKSQIAELEAQMDRTQGLGTKEKAHASKDANMFFIDIGSMGPTSQLAICAGGVLVLYLTFGLCQVLNTQKRPHTHTTLAHTHAQDGVVYDTCLCVCVCLQEYLIKVKYADGMGWYITLSQFSYYTSFAFAQRKYSCRGQESPWARTVPVRFEVVPLHSPLYTKKKRTQVLVLRH